MKVKSTYIWWEADQKSRFWHYTKPDLAQVSAGDGEDRHRDNNNTQKSASVNHDQKIMIKLICSCVLMISPRVMTQA